MSNVTVSANQAAHNAAMGVAPGATRAYWHMRCSANGRLTKTVSVAPDNSLKSAPQLFSKTQEPSAGSLVTSEVQAENIENVLETSQDAESANATDNSLPNEADLAANGSINMLSGEQKAVLHMVLNGRKNIFFTGAAGTGKSVLLRCIIHQLQKKHGRHRIGVTALTGIAACNIGGQTLHRFGGVGLGRDSVDELVRKIRYNATTLMRWEETQVLLIDEVSMLDIDLLEKLEEIARRLRGNDIPFGGIQIICTGDLFQLPPVEKRVVERRFCFETPLWDKLIDRTVNLTRVFRQQDPGFARTLNELRLGHVSPESEELFSGLSRPPKLPKGIVPTQLFSTRREVTQSNESALRRLVGTEYVYDCADWKDTSRPETRFMDVGRDVLAEERLKLKVGAQVMLIKNIDNSLVNGSVGRVVAFMSPNASYKDYGSNEQGESHFRSRSVSTDADANGRQEGSDAKNVAQILGAYGDSASAKRKRKLAEEMTAAEAPKSAVFPVVRFVTSQNTVRFMMVHPETWEIADMDGNPMVSRTQLPLILAWALSVHKSQGQTLPYVCVDLKNIFERGQAYVAISRATCVEGLQVVNFSSRKVLASPKVVQYYEKLETVSTKEIESAESYFREEARKEEEHQRALIAAELAAKAVREKLKRAEAEGEEDKAELTPKDVSSFSDDADPEYVPNSGSEPVSEHFELLQDPKVINLISDSDPSDIDHIASVLCGSQENGKQNKRRRIVIESSSPPS